jgi:hypothetical protein
MALLSKDERLALIKENLAEALNVEIIEKILDEGRNPKIYWGRHQNLESTYSKLTKKLQAPRLLAGFIAVTLCQPSRSPSTSQLVVR